MKIAVIGFGAIGSFIVERLNTEPSVEVSAVFSLPRPELSSVPVVDNIDSLLATRPELVVECAGHEGLRNSGEAVIRHGTDLLVVSVGALADAALEHALRNAAANGGGRLLIPGGALGGIDTVSAAREAGLDSLEYSGRKPPKAWMGTPAEEMIELASVTKATAFLECDARTAALQFPQNANVVAALALAGLGFDKTKVRLIVDPDANGNNHSFVARGAFGELSTSIRSTTLPSNPKTSVLAPFSLIQTIKKRAGLILA